MIIPRGPEQGGVLFLDEVGQVAVWHEADPDVLEATVWCNALYRGPATTQWGECRYQVFCAGNTTDRDGNFIFMGGAIWPPPPQIPPIPVDPTADGSCAIAYFDPTKIGLNLNPWTPGPNMLNQRWYGTVVTMLKTFDGRPFILGGSKGTSGLDIGLGTRDWERLLPVPFVGSLTTCDALDNCPSPLDTPPLDSPPSTIDDALNDPDNFTKFEYYPRMHQLAGPYGEFFIAGDTQPSYVNCDSGSSNEPGEMWFLRPPANGATMGVLEEAPFTDKDDGIDMNRYYGSSVMLHQLPENGGTNRVLIFGGSNGCTGPSTCNCPPSSDGVNVQIRSSVKELNYVPSATPGASSTLIDKTPLKCGRVYTNAVVLPTGEIFISRGAKSDAYVTTDGLDYTDPHLWAEIYNPGPTKTSPGTSEWTAKIPSTFANWTEVNGYWAHTGLPVPTPNMKPPRIYHHLAMLLPSGRVLVAGGDEVPGITDICDDPEFDLEFGTSSFSGELYEPPYFHKGYSVKITGADSTATFLGTANIACKIIGAPTSAYIDRVVFIRTGSLTHHQDSSQVYVEAEFEVTAISTDLKAFVLSATLPRSTMMPPGYYMVYVVGRNGAHRVPSQGVFIKVD